MFAIERVYCPCVISRNKYAKFVHFALAGSPVVVPCGSPVVVPRMRQTTLAGSPVESIKTTQISIVPRSLVGFFYLWRWCLFSGYCLYFFGVSLLLPCGVTKRPVVVRSLSRASGDRGALPFDQKVGTKELPVRSGNQATLGWFLGSKRNFLDKNFEISKIAALGPAITAVLANFAIFEF